MTYELERSAIETYVRSFWNDRTPLGMDGHVFKPAANTCRLHIVSGRVFQGSIGRIRNRKDHVGVVMFSIYTAGGAGSNAWRSLADAAMEMFHEVTIDQYGEVSRDPSVSFVRWSPPGSGNEEGQHPYIGVMETEEPLYKVNVNAPFVRYSFS